jgi:hypothetical protein
MTIRPCTRRLSMIFPENQYPPRIASGADFFGIML